MLELQIKQDAAPARSKVDLRVRVAAGSAALLSLAAMRDATVLQLGPDRWLLLSDRQDAGALIAACSAALGDTLHLACDASSALACLGISGNFARRLLAMGCGLNLDKDISAGTRHWRTRFAGLAVVIHAVGDRQFDLYVDRSCGQWLADWLTEAATDPILKRDNKNASI